MEFAFVFFKNPTNTRLAKKGQIYMYPFLDKVYDFDSLQGFPFNSIPNLNEKVVWFTNLTEEQINKLNNDIKKIYKVQIDFKNLDFFGITYKDLEQDLSLNFLELDWKEKNLRICAIFFNILKFFQLNYPKQNFLFFNKKTLVAGLYNQIFQKNRKIVNHTFNDMKLDYIIGQTYQKKINCFYTEIKDNSKKIEIVMRKNRYLHTQYILTLPYPYGNIYHYFLKDINHNNPLIWVLEQEKPALIKVNIRGITPRMRGILGFRNFNNQKSYIKDEWINNFELELYARYATDIEILEVYIWEQWAKTDTKVINLKSFLKDDDLLLSLSLSYQCLSEIYMNMVNLVEDKVEGDYNLGGRIASIRSVWQWIYNKIIIFNMVELLYKRFDIQILEYDFGQIKLMVDPQELHLIYQLVKNSGWSFPIFADENHSKNLGLEAIRISNTQNL